MDLGTLFLCLFASLFLMFIAPLGKSNYSPDWQFLKMLLMDFVFYISYVLVSYRPATAEELEKAKAAGENVFESTTSATKSTFSFLVSCALGVLSVTPSLIWNALNPVVAIKEIKNVKYALIDTSLPTIGGSLFGLALIAIIVFITLYVATALITIVGTIALAVLTVVKFFRNRKLD